KKGKKRIYRIRLANASETLAFFVNPSVRKGKEGQEILPSFWSDNYFSILPGKARDVTVEFEGVNLEGEESYLKLEGWNTPPKLIKLD
ncbi:MAG: glycoside hydrolase family 2 protein, partial [Candidatus Aminicenantaceae bacterium]